MRAPTVVNTNNVFAHPKKVLTYMTVVNVKNMLQIYLLKIFQKRFYCAGKIRRWMEKPMDINGGKTVAVKF